MGLPFTDDDFNYDKPKSTIPGVKFNYKKPYPKDNNFWWIEFGGNLNTIFDANDIQYELKRIAYGVWEYMKNNPDGRCKNYDLDWIGSLPGKRESTRYIGPHILTQNDVMSGGHFPDVIAYGGWTLDNHHPDAFHRKGIFSVEHTTPERFGIPFDCLYSVNVPNLMFAGRDISATHMGLSSTRVMSTCALLGQAAGTGAALAIKYGTTRPESARITSPSFRTCLRTMTACCLTGGESHQSSRCPQPQPTRTCLFATESTANGTERTTACGWPRATRASFTAGKACGTDRCPHHLRLRLQVQEQEDAQA